MKKYCLLIFICIVTNINSQTQKSDPYFVITKDTVSIHGPHSITRSVLQDKSGNMWLASWEGIIKYDGKVFTNYTLKNNLIKFHMFAAMEDSKGNLWFGSIRGGVYKYDGKTFRLFTTESGLANDMVLCMLEDKAGNIWFGTGEGVSRYDGKTFVNFSVKDGLLGTEVNSMIQDKTGRIWFGTRYASGSDVTYYDGKSFTNFKNKEGIAFANVRSMIQDKNGYIWIGGQSGLWRYDPNAMLSGSGKAIVNFSTYFTGYIFEDKKGNLWTSEGEPNIRDTNWNQGDGMALYKFNPSNTIKPREKIKHERQVFGISEDNKSNIWFCTENGVSRYDGNTIKEFKK